MSTHNPLESKSSAPSRKKIEAGNLTITSVNICPMCAGPMKAMQIGRNKVDAYICLEDRVALPVENKL